ncbi:hypothetical protein [Phenylobacterium sp.]|jgi:hypothetical protein|uniref:hypothetical protein n=1 Tax=Phenylobacterium sp. TaxID=1871053 RepID=UPI002F3EFFF0
MPDTNAPAVREQTSTAAIVTYIALGELGLSLIAVLVLIILRRPIDPVMVGILGTILGTITTIAVAAAGFWVGGSAGGKTANAALAQIAGAGPPSPAAPLGPTPAPDPSAPVVPADTDLGIPLKPGESP